MLEKMRSLSSSITRLRLCRFLPDLRPLGRGRCTCLAVGMLRWCASPSTVGSARSAALLGLWLAQSTPLTPSPFRGAFSGDGDLMVGSVSIAEVRGLAAREGATDSASLLCAAFRELFCSLPVTAASSVRLRQSAGRRGIRCARSAGRASLYRLCRRSNASMISSSRSGVRSS